MTAWLEVVALASTPTDGNIPLTSFTGTLDGTALGNGMRVLLKHQTTASQNVTYTYSTSTHAFTPVSGDTFENQSTLRCDGGISQAHTEWTLKDVTTYRWARQFVQANVRDFGARGNGVNDDSQEIANAVLAMASGGGGVVFPPGTYLIGAAATVSVPANVQLTFEEGASVVATSPLSINGRITAHPTQQIFGVAWNGTVSSSGTTPPPVSVSGFANAAYSVKLVVTASGTLGTAVFECSLNGGTSYLTGITIPTNGVYVIPGTGVTVTFSSGSYTAGSTPDTYTWTTTPGSAVTLSSLVAESLRAKWFGAQGNSLAVVDGAMTAGSPILTCSTSTPFRATDIGKSVVVAGAGPSGANLVTTILSYTSSSAVALNSSAGVGVTGAAVQYGTDDATAIRNAYSSSPSEGVLQFAPGAYFLGSAINIPPGIQAAFLQGASLAPAGVVATISGSIAASPTQAIFQGFGPLGSVTPSGSPITVGGCAGGAYSCVVRILSGIAPSVTVTSGGTGYQAGTSVTFSPSPNGNVALGTVSVSGGAVQSPVTVTSPGSGYASPPSVSFSGPGTGASAVATVDGGVVESVAVSSPGSGYSAAPSITFGTPPGSGAAATATVTMGTLTAITVTDGGSGYASRPSITIGGAGAVAGPPTMLSSTLSAGVTFQYSLNGGAAWSAPVTIAGSGSYAFSIPQTGIIVNFAPGSYTGGQTYSWTSSSPVLLTAEAGERFPVKWWGATGGGSTDDGPAISRAAAAFPSGALVFSPGTYVVKTSFSTSPQVDFEFKSGAMVSLASSSLTVRGRIAAHPTQQVFAGVGPLSPISHATGSSTAIVGLSGSPIGAYLFSMNILTGGTLAAGSGSITFQVIYNDYVLWTPVINATASGFAYTVPGTGVTITFGAGTYTGAGAAGQDTYTWTTTAPVLLSSSATDRVSAKWWGAVGDGITDDTAALQAALSSFQNSYYDDSSALATYGGGTLFIPPGTYLVSSSLNTPGNVPGVYGYNSNLVIAGAGRDATVLKASGPNPYFSVIQNILGLEISASVNLTIQDLTITASFNSNQMTEGGTGLLTTWEAGQHYPAGSVITSGLSNRLLQTNAGESRGLLGRSANCGVES